MNLNQIYVQKLDYKIEGDDFLSMSFVDQEESGEPVPFFDQIRKFKNGDIYKVLLKRPGQNEFFNFRNRRMANADRNRLALGQNPRSCNFVIQVKNQQNLFNGEVCVITFIKNLTHIIKYIENREELEDNQIRY